MSKALVFAHHFFGYRLRWYGELGVGFQKRAGSIALALVLRVLSIEKLLIRKTLNDLP